MRVYTEVGLGLWSVGFWTEPELELVCWGAGVLHHPCHPKENRGKSGSAGERASSELDANFCPHKIHNCNYVTAINMPGPTNTLLIEGSFQELADELAHYIDEVQKKHTPDNANLQAEITPLLEKGQKDEVLKKLVTASDVLNTAPEKGRLAFRISVQAIC